MNNFACIYNLNKKKMSLLLNDVGIIYARERMVDGI